MFESEGSVKYWSKNTRNTFPASRSVEVLLPIPLLFLKKCILDGRHLRESLRFRIELSSKIAVSGAVSDVSLDNVEFVVKSVEEDAVDVQARNAIQINIHKR